MRKGFAQILILGFIIAVLALGWAFYTKQLLKSHPVSQNNTSNTSTSSNQLNPNSTPEVKLAEKDYFQKILSEKCKEFPIQGAAYNPGTKQPSGNWIKLEDLPVSINTTNVPFNFKLWGVVSPQTSASMYCQENIGAAESDNLVLASKEKNLYTLFFPPIATKFSEVGNIKLSAYFNWPEGGPTYPGGLGAIVEGVKTLTLKDGNIIYIGATGTLLDSKNPRLIKFLEQYTAPDSVYSGNPIDDNKYSPVLIFNDFKNLFLNDPSNLGSPEKENVNSIVQILNSVTAK